MGERAIGINPTTSGNGWVSTELSSRENTRQLDGEIAILRGELARLVAELDRRRHELFDVRLQTRRHALGVTLTGVGLLSAASGLVWLQIWRTRRRQSRLAQLGRFREAVSRMIARPERVAREPGMLGKIATAAASATVATAIKKALEWGIRRAVQSDRHRWSTIARARTSKASQRAPFTHNSTNRAMVGKGLSRPAGSS